MINAIQQIVNGLSVGAIYGLIAVGFSLVYGMLGLVNFAHGDVLMAGTFVALWAKLELHLNWAIAAVVGMASAAALSVVLELVASRPVRNSPRMIPMITTLGAALVVRSGVQATAGSSTRPFTTSISGKAFHIGHVRITFMSLLILGVSIVVISAFALFLKFHKAGYAIRAAAQDLDAAALMGVSINWTVVVMFAIGGALGTLGGILYASSVQAASIGFGFAILLKGFAAAVLGGIGNLKGALLGGLVLGVLESLIGTYWSTEYLDAIAFAVLIVVLLVRPNGILGAQVQERV